MLITSGSIQIFMLSDKVIKIKGLDEKSSKKNAKLL
jgi:hypothetical protein